MTLRRCIHASTSRIGLNAGRFIPRGDMSLRCLSSSPWADYAMAPPDPIIGLGDAFRADDFPQKVIVGVGAYRDDLGKPYVLPCVREAETILQDQLLDHEYSGIVSVYLCVCATGCSSRCGCTCSQRTLPLYPTNHQLSHFRSFVVTLCREVTQCL